MAVARHATGMTLRRDYSDTGGTVFTIDTMNNVGRRCSIRGNGEYRMWKVWRAVKGRRYMVRHLVTGEFRTVSHNEMSSLY